MLFRSAQPRPDHPKPHGEAPGRTVQRGRTERHTLGSIIWLAMLRLTAVVIVAWYMKGQIADSDYGQWWMITIGALYGIAIYPAQIQYSYFKRTSKKLIEQTLCSSCRHFNPEGLHCMLLDEHVSEIYLPCEGEGWEPKSFEED